MDTSNRNTALASAMVEELGRCGVRHVAIAPGSRSTPLALALFRSSTIETTSIVDERAAAFFALGAAQATTAPAVVLTTSGTAAANLHPAICEADEAGVPLVALTADRPPELRDIGAGQTIDQLKLYGDAVRWFCEVGTHEADDAGLMHFRSIACRAFAAARGDPRPGPVHLNIAWRDPLGPEPRPADVTATSALALAGREAGRPLTTVPPAPPLPAEALIGAVVDRIRGARRGLIIAGRMADASAAPAIAALARAARFPILAEPTSQLRLGPHDRDLVVWAYEPIARTASQALAPDLVLRFGDMPTSKPLRLWLLALEDTAQLVVDSQHRWNEPNRRAGAIVRAAPATLAWEVAERIAPGARDDAWARTWLSAAKAAGAAIESELSALAEPTEPGAHAALARLYADGDLVYTASSMPIRDQEAFVPTGAADVRFLCNRGANGIDGLVSSGIGAAKASGRPTWILTGDLGLYHDMNALAILRHVEAPVRIVVLNNDGGGIFELLPQASQVTREEFEALFGTPLGLDLDRVAHLHNLRFARADALADLAVMDTSETMLIEIPVDRRANVELHRRIATRATEAVLAATGGE